MADVVGYLTALGAGSVVGSWYSASRDRRAARSGVLKAIAETESKRWAGDPNSTDYPQFVTAIRELETAALVARIPRLAVRHYVVLADAARRLSDDNYDLHGADDEPSGPIDAYFDTTVRDAAEILTQLAWRPWWTRMVLRIRLRCLRSHVQEASYQEKGIERTLAGSQRIRGVLAGPLGELPGVRLASPTILPPPTPHY